jgi:hypothetical protein
VASGDCVIERDGCCLGVLVVGDFRRGSNKLRARVNLRGLDVQIDCVQRDGCGVLDDIETSCVLEPKHIMGANYRMHILNDDLTLILEGLKVGFQSQVVVEGLDVLGQNLTTFGNVEVGPHCISIAATHSSVRAVTSLNTGSRKAGVGVWTKSGLALRDSGGVGRDRRGSEEVGARS